MPDSKGTRLICSNYKCKDRTIRFRNSDLIDGYECPSCGHQLTARLPLSANELKRLAKAKQQFEEQGLVGY